MIRILIGQLATVLIGCEPFQTTWVSYKVIGKSLYHVRFLFAWSTPAVDPIGMFQVVSGWLHSLRKFQVSCFAFLHFAEL